MNPPSFLPAGSEAERKAVETAAKHGTKAHIYTNKEWGDDISVTVDTQEAYTGQDISLRVILKNRSSMPRSVSLNLFVAVMYYTGVTGSNFKQEQRQVQIPAGGGNRLRLPEARHLVPKLGGRLRRLRVLEFIIGMYLFARAMVVFSQKMAMFASLDLRYI